MMSRLSVLGCCDRENAAVIPVNVHVWLIVLVVSRQPVEQGDFNNFAKIQMPRMLDPVLTFRLARDKRTP